MLAAVDVLKLYFVGTALTVLIVIYEIVDSFGGQMHVKNQRYFSDGCTPSIERRILMKRRDDDG